LSYIQEKQNFRALKQRFLTKKFVAGFIVSSAALFLLIRPLASSADVVYLFSSSSKNDSISDIPQIQNGTSTQQTLPLLKATINTLFVGQDEDNLADATSSLTSQDSDGPIVDGSVLSDDGSSDASSTAGSAVDIDDASSDQISLYTVRPGDQIEQIAKMYNVSVNTIMWSNDLKKGQPLTPDQVLVILPVSGLKYTVKSGDTLTGIAKKYGLNPDDLARFNNLDSSSTTGQNSNELKVGDEIVIPDVEGRLTSNNAKNQGQNGNQAASQGQSGSSKSSSATPASLTVSGPKPSNSASAGTAKSGKGKITKSSSGKTSTFNKSQASNQTQPNNSKATTVTSQPSSSPSISAGTDTAGSGPSTVASASVTQTETTSSTADSSTAYFIRPIVGGIKTQGLHGHNGVDLASSLNTPIMAAASGQVIVAKEGGWNGGYGSYVVIQHPNGMQTLYGHMNQVLVAVGQNVTQGQEIGKMGRTGEATGVHLHFEVRGGVNPF